MSDSQTQCGPPPFPKRAVITGGMPYGNKDLHFGHIGGVFVQADVFARFLRDRIGAENVIFVSGTDCYGSPIVEDHRKQVEAGAIDGDLVSFVTANHSRQKDTLAAYEVFPSEFAASALDPFREIHEAIGAEILSTLHANGHLEKRTTAQFYDSGRDIFLNGRQVIGRCPIAGCQAEKAYADECALGHQYEPRELIAPRSTLTGQAPEMRDVTNWYIRLGEFRDVLLKLMDRFDADGDWRHFVLRGMREFFEPPTIHITRDQLEQLAEVVDALPRHDNQEGRGKSVQLVFDSLEDMNAACSTLAGAGIRYRTGKTLVPFRMTGNLDWGLRAPDIDGLHDLTFWVWPESLWAPISFTAAHLAKSGRTTETWRDWWCSVDAKVYQFIGEDNVFFYGLPEMAMFLGMQGPTPCETPANGHLQIPHLIANRHVLFLDKKASSSGKVKPPMAVELLDYYTPDQLRAHFLSMALGQRSVSFRPKPLSPEANQKGADAVLKEGNLLCNAFNRAARSCFYTAQKFFDGRIPEGDVSGEVLKEMEKATQDYEWAMYRHEFQQVIVIVGDLIRSINQKWSQCNPFYDDCPEHKRGQALLDAFHMVRTAVTLVHPIAPDGAERIREYLNLGEALWDWSRLSESIRALADTTEDHQLKPVPSHFDFFPKHQSQLPPG